MTEVTRVLKRDRSHKALHFRVERCVVSFIAEKAGNDFRPQVTSAVAVVSALRLRVRKTRSGWAEAGKLLVAGEEVLTAINDTGSLVHKTLSAPA